MEYTVFNLLLLFLTGLGTAIVNTMAGGGSFVSLPILIFLGLPPTVANGTNRLGIFIQSIFASRSFHRQKVLPLRFSLLVSIPAVIGASLGAWFATIVGDAEFKNILAILMIVVTLVTFIRTKRPEMGSVPELSGGNWVFVHILFFFIGLYGGFIQAGVGFFLLAGLTWVGFDLVAANAVKVFTALFFTIFALAIFIMGDKVLFIPGLVLGAGSMVGATIGARIAVRQGHDFIRKVVVVAVIAMALKLLFS